MTWRTPTKAQLSLWKALEKPQCRRREGLFLAEGLKVVSELLTSDYQVQALLVMETKQTRWHAFVTAIDRDIDIISVTAKQWQMVTQDKNPEGIMAVVIIPRPLTLSLLPPRRHILLAHRINNPNNLGALVRTAQWFGFGAILLSSDSVDFTNSKVVRASMGSLFHLPIIPDLDFTAIVPELKADYFLIASHNRKGVAPHPCIRAAALLVGSESHGLPRSLTAMADETWAIPGVGGVDSLSVPQAAAIMMYEAVKRSVA